MILKRVLHPVGQGAFYTEHSDNRDKECAWLNVVYDCGSKTCLQDGISTLVESGIRSAFNIKEHIDLLVISLFDEDHTNGLKTLLEITETADLTSSKSLALNRLQASLVRFRLPAIFRLLETFVTNGRAERIKVNRTIKEPV